MNTEEDSLVIFERAALMLAEADTVQKCKAGKDLCATAERYAKARKWSEESIQHCRSYALEFERQMGEMLKGKPNPSQEHGGPGRGKKGSVSDTPPFSETPTFEELGITKEDSRSARAVADLPDDAFQAVKAGTISKKAAIKQSKVARQLLNGQKKPRRAPKRHDQADEVVNLADGGLSTAEIASKTGVSARQVRHVVEEEAIRREAKAEEPEIDPATLSMTAQKKLELAIRQHKEKLTAEWRIAVSTRVDELLINTIGPRLKKEQDQARWIMKSRKGIMSRKEYGKILACLHPDWVTDSKQKERYADAFRDFTKMEKLLLDEKESPTEYVFTPEGRVDWEELKRQASVARKAKRAASKSGIRPSP